MVDFEGLADPQRFGDLRLQRGKDQGVPSFFLRKLCGVQGRRQRISTFFVRFLVWNFLACSLVGEALIHRFA